MCVCVCFWSLKRDFCVRSLSDSKKMRRYNRNDVDFFFFFWKALLFFDRLISKSENSSFFSSLLRINLNLKKKFDWENRQIEFTEDIDAPTNENYSILWMMLFFFFLDAFVFAAYCSVVEVDVSNRWPISSKFDDLHRRKNTHRHTQRNWFQAKSKNYHLFSLRTPKRTWQHLAIPSNWRKGAAQMYL